MRIDLGPRRLRDLGRSRRTQATQEYRNIPNEGLYRKACSRFPAIKAASGEVTERG